MNKILSFISPFAFALPMLLIADSGEYVHVVQYKQTDGVWIRNELYTITNSENDNQNANLIGIDIGDADNDGFNELYMGFDSTDGSYPFYRDIKSIKLIDQNWIVNHLNIEFSNGCDACVPSGVSVADINGDGINELYAIGNSIGLDVFISLENGSWSSEYIFQWNEWSGGNTQYLRKDDFDGDGSHELYVGLSTGCYCGFTKTIFWQDDAYSWTSSSSDGTPKHIVIDDFDYDGLNEYIISHNGHGNPPCNYNCGWATITYYDGDSNEDIYSYPSYNSGAFFLISADLDQNQFQEIYFNNYEYLIKYEFDGAFWSGDTIINQYFNKAITFDINNDGENEVFLLTNGNEIVQLIYNENNWSIENVHSTNSLNDWAFGDADNDGEYEIYTIENEWYYIPLTADFTADVTSGEVPLTVQFTDQSITDANPIETWQWDFNNDGVYDSYEQNPTWNYTVADTHTVKLFISDGNYTATGIKENYIYTYTVNPLYGCTNPIAINYDPNANTDDGSCEFYNGPVWYVSENGSDNSGNGTMQYPFQNIQTAIDTTVVGDTVWVLPGSIQENIIINKNITLMGSGADTTFLYRDPDESGNIVIIQSDCYIEGFTIINDYDWGTTVQIESGSPTLVRNIIKYNGDYEAGTMINCQASTSPEIINNDIIFHFIGSYFGGQGIYVNESSSPIIKNNIFYSNQTGSSGPDGIDCRSSTYTIAYNDFFGFQENFRQCDGCIEDLTGVDGNISEDPLFHDFENNDYSLNWSSPCIDGGDPALPLDPDDTVSDIGYKPFYQIEGTPPTPTNLVVDIATTYLTLNWEIESTNDIESFIIYRSLEPDPTTEIATGSYSSTSYQDNNVEPDILYYYRVASYGYNGVTSYYSNNAYGVPHNQILRVPEDFSLIQSAFNNAIEGDSILVNDGTYTENLIWPQIDNLTLQSINGSDVTVIDGSGDSESCLYVGNGQENVLVDGFTFQNGYGSIPTFHNDKFGGGILIDENVSGLITNCTIRDNGDPNLGNGGGGMFVSLGSSVIIDGCVFYNNIAYEDGSALWYRSSNSYGDVRNCLFYNNECTTSAYDNAVIFCQSSPIRFTNNTITDNIGKGIHIYSPWPTITNNIVYDNTGAGFHANSGSEYDLLTYNYGVGNCGENGNIDEWCWTEDGEITYPPPLFNNPDSSDYSLQFGSPCIDSGNPDLNGDGITWEFDVDDQDPDGTRMDMGALNYYQITGCIDTTACNYNQDADVDDGSCEYNLGAWHVSADGDDDNCGSEEYPLSSIQHGIDISSDSDTVLVSAGTYFEHLLLTGKNIVLMSSDGAENTIIDADSLSRNLIIENGVGNATVIDGFTIQNGTTTSSLYGGGIFCNYTSPIIKNCIFLNNYAEQGGAVAFNASEGAQVINSSFSNNYAGDNGGALGIYSGSGVIIDSCNFANNESDNYGGAIDIHGSGGNDLPIRIQNSNILDNISGDYGGGIQFRTSSNSIIENCKIMNNNSDYGGGIYMPSATLEIISSQITGNSAPGNGGGFYLYYSNLMISNSTISGNTTATEGGGIYAIGGNTSIVNSILWNNTPVEIDNQATVIYSNIQGGWEGTGNIDADPLFCNSDNTDFTLYDYSPCVGTGQDGANMGAYGIGCEDYYGPTWYVSTTGSNDNDGSEENPFATIGYGINVASNGDTVLVSAGTYFEHLQINKNITIDGIDKETTIIDGQNNNVCVKFDGDTDSTAVLKNLTIQNGYGGDYEAGGIYFDNAGGKLESVIITNNNNTNNSNQGYNSAGGILLYGYSSWVVIRNSEITSNSGGAIVSDLGALIISNSLINENDGNSVRFYYSYFNMDRCMVINSGSLFFNNQRDHIIKNSIFYNETSNYAIYDDDAYEDLGMCINCTIYGPEGSLVHSFNLINSIFKPAYGNCHAPGDWHSPQIVYSNIDGGDPLSCQGEGNIFFPEEFNNFEELDFGLTDSSFSISSGIDSYVLAYSDIHQEHYGSSPTQGVYETDTLLTITPYDFLGNNRPIPENTNPDLGAIENDLGWNDYFDCTGELGGEAFWDDCGVCSGGNSGHEENSDIDCLGVCFGENQFDLLGECCVIEELDICLQCYGNNYDQCDSDNDGIPNIEDWGYGAHSINVEDIPNDQGGKVYVSFTGSFYDDTEPIRNTEIYHIQRNDDVGWVTVGSSPTLADSVYFIEATTLADSSGETDGMTEFRIVASMDEGTFISLDDENGFGYSVDNIAPSVPSGLTYSGLGGLLSLYWDSPVDEDFQYFSVFLDSVLAGYSTEPEFDYEIGMESDEILVGLTATDTHGNESELATYTVLLTVNDALAFTPNWNLMSFDIAIEDNAPEDVFAEFVNSGNLIYVTGFGLFGSMYYDPTAPPPFNTLTSIEPGLGYWVKLNDSDDITREGMPLTLNTDIDLMQSWNLIGYWPSENMSPEEAFAELISNGNLQYATGFDEGFTFYDPSLEPFLNTLTALENGYGYWLKLNEAVEGFQYPEPSGAVAKQLALNPNPDIVKTNSAMFVSGTVSFKDIDVEEGTRVNIYTESGLLVGEMDIVNNNYLRTGAIYGDDMTTEAVDGALQDEALVFRYNEYISDPVSISFSSNMELAKVDLVFRNIPETFTLHQNFPNPFNPITTLRYDLPEDNFVVLTVYDMLGRTIVQLVNTAQEAGFKSVQWDAKGSMGKPVSAGVYLYQIQAGEFVQTKKMVLLK